MEYTLDWVATSALFVAGIALALSIYEGYQNRRHNRLSVKPHIGLNFDVGPDRKSQVYFRNEGLGPAILRNISIQVNGGEKFSGMTAEGIENALKAVLPSEQFPCPYDALTIDPGEAFIVGEKRIMLELPLYSVSDGKYLGLVKGLGSLTWTFEYESFYGEKFTSGGSFRVSERQIQDLENLNKDSDAVRPDSTTEEREA